MEKLEKCLCCGSRSLHIGSTEKARPLIWYSERAKGLFSNKLKYKLSSKLCSDCGFVHWFATGNFNELNEK